MNDAAEIKSLLDQIDQVKAENAALEAELAGATSSAQAGGRRFGFIGVGTINAAVLRGLLTSEAGKELVGSVSLSPRNAAKAAALKDQFSSVVTVCASNQDVVDNSDWVFLATPPKPEITEATYRPLNFRSDQTVVSLIAGLAPALLAELCAPVPKTEIVQAFPLPPAEHQASTTVMCPRHAAAEALFDMVGKTVAVDSYEQAISIGVMSCTMGDFYQAQQARFEWLRKQGIGEEAATSAIAAYFATFNDASLRATAQGHAGFAHLVAEQTPGGMNEQVIREMTENGSYKNLDAAMDNVYKRMMG